MALSWFDITEAASLAAELAEHYCLRRDATQQRNPKKLARLTRSQDDLTRRVQLFNRTHRFNFYKRAQLLMQLKQGLSARGVPEAEAAGVMDEYLAAGARSDQAGS